MKINFPSLFQTPLQKYRFFFIFGNDGTVIERSVSFLQKKLNLPFQIKDEDFVLTQQDNQLSLFDDREKTSLTLISPVTDKVLSQIEAFQEGIYIFTSEKARAQSRLVTYFTTSPISLAIGAYASPIVVSEFEFLIAGMNLSVSLKKLLLNAYQNDYRGLLTTLEKIKLFGEISENDYDSFLNFSQTEDDLGPLLHAFLLKDLKKITALFSQGYAVDLIPFFRSLSRSFLILYGLMPFKESPQSIPWFKVTPPVFFKEQPLYEVALSKWTPKEVQTFLEKLLSLEKRVKHKSLTLSEANQSLLNIL